MSSASRAVNGGETYLSPGDLVARWRGRIKLQTLANWRTPKINRGPRFTRVGTRVLYSIEAVIDFENENCFGPDGKAVA